MCWKCWKSEPKNCWRFWRCSDSAKERCPVYKADQGRKCWTFSQNLEPFEWVKSERNFKSCLQCDWYKKVQLADSEE